MNPKLTQIKRDRAKRKLALEQKRFEASQQAIKDTQQSIDKLYELLNDKEDFDAEKLGNQIESLSQVLDIREQVAEITKAIQDNKTEVNIEPADFSKIVDAIKQNKPIVNVDLESVRKAIIDLTQRVQEGSVEEGVSPESFKPVRRVVKQGNRLVFDDQPTTASRAGGGGSSSSTSSTGGLTDTELRASAVSVTGTFWQATQPVSAVSLPIPSGAATSENQTTEQGLVGALAETAPASDTASSGLNGRLQRISQRLTSFIALFPTSIGQKTKANSLAVAIASDQDILVTRLADASTPAFTSVNVLTTSTVILAGNATRLGATFYNESGAIVYLKLGASASVTSYTAQIPINAYYEVPFNYTGQITGITLAITAVTRVTELTA